MCFVLPEGSGYSPAPAVRSSLERGGGIVAALALMGQWSALHFLFPAASPVVTATSAGIGIFGAAFALSWAAEVSQLDIPAALSVAFLALIAVLPEYAVDIYLVWQAGTDPTYIQYAAANMTGANRILIGLGWPVVVFAYWWRSRSREIVLDQQQGTELYYLLLATVYSFIIPLKGTLSLADCFVLVSLFVVYIIVAARAGVEEPELEGTAEYLATFATATRRALTLALFAVSGFTIFLAAEPFAESLLEIGHQFGIDEYLLIQWLAPLASESPEFIIAILFAWKLKPKIGFSALLSSKVNQWTLLIGMLPLAYSISRGEPSAMNLVGRQSQEILLTSAQSLFAIVVLADLRFGIAEAVALMVLFLIQLAFPDPAVRRAFVGIYLGLSVALPLMRPGTRNGLIALVKRRPFS